MRTLTPKDKALIALLAAVVLLPVVLLSNWGLGQMEKLACRNAPARWAAGLQLKVAAVYGLTLRRQSQREAYRRFAASFPQHPRRGYAKFRIAVSLEGDENTSKDRTLEAYEEFLDEFWDDPNSAEYVSEAERAVRRLRGL